MKGQDLSKCRPRESERDAQRCPEGVALLDMPNAKTSGRPFDATTVGLRLLSRPKPNQTGPLHNSVTRRRTRASMVSNTPNHDVPEQTDKKHQTPAPNGKACNSWGRPIWTFRRSSMLVRIIGKHRLSTSIEFWIWVDCEQRITRCVDMSRSAGVHGRDITYQMCDILRLLRLCCGGLSDYCRRRRRRLRLRASLRHV